MTRPYPHLFAPLRVGPVELANRVILSPMTTAFGFRDGAPEEEIEAYFRARAAGTGMAVVGFGAVTPEGRVEERIPWMWRSDAGRAMRPLARAIHGAGALACLQLAHAGRQAPPEVIGGAPVAPSALPAHAHVRATPVALSTAAAEEIVAAFGRAAAAAAEAGFDALELHAAHGYLVHQFLSALANRRTDRYGGATVAERARFGTACVRAVRDAAPRLAVLVRINGDDCMPGGMGADDAADAARAFADAGADAITVSGGVYGSTPYTVPVLDDPEGLFLDAAAEVRRRVGVPVAAVGRIATPQTAEAAVARGACDAVAVGRALLADPAWARKAAAGRAADIRPCIGTVQGCQGSLQRGDPASCVVNPELGRETRRPSPRGAPSRVVVVGAGPAGLEAACRAAELGHHVTVLERETQIGGAARLAARTPPLASFTRLLEWYARRLGAAGAEVRLGVDADGAAVATLRPDLVIVAVGGRTEIPLLDGYDRLPAWPLEDLLGERPSSTGTRALPSRPLVLGGGQRALATALWLSGRGARTSVVSDEGFGRDAPGIVRGAYLARLERHGVALLTGRAERLESDGVLVTGGDGATRLSPADGVVLAGRVRSERLTGDPGVPVVRIGDAKLGRDLAAAIAEGYDAAGAIGQRAR